MALFDLPGVVPAVKKSCVGAFLILHVALEDEVASRAKFPSLVGWNNFVVAVNDFHLIWKTIARFCLAVI